MELNLHGGMVIANPVPKEHELSKDYIDTIIEEVVKDSIANGIIGKDSTPFLLKTIVEKQMAKA